MSWNFPAARRSSRKTDGFIEMLEILVCSRLLWGLSGRRNGETSSLMITDREGKLEAHHFDIHSTKMIFFIVTLITFYWFSSLPLQFLRIAIIDFNYCECYFYWTMTTAILGPRLQSKLERPEHLCNLNAPAHINDDASRETTSFTKCFIVKSCVHLVHGKALGCFSI